MVSWTTLLLVLTKKTNSEKKLPLTLRRYYLGEKYMGMWQADAKHGSAILVTLDGLYIEGCFNNNKMTVYSVLPFFDTN